MSDTPPVVESESVPAVEEAAPVEPSTEELLAAAPPLVLPEGTSIIKQCSCGLKLDNPPAGLVCPNCGATVP